jgi:hypothetical protein
MEAMGISDSFYIMRLIATLTYSSMRVLDVQMDLLSRAARSEQRALPHQKFDFPVARETDMTSRWTLKHHA